MKTLKLLIIAFTAFAIGGLVADLAGVSPVLGALASFGLSFVATPTGALFTALNVTDLNAALGAYYRDHNEIFWESVFFDGNLAGRFRPIDGVSDEKVVIHDEIDFEVQPGLDKRTTNFQADAVKFGAQLLKVRDGKVDLLMYPAEMHKTWLGKYKQKGSDPFDLIFEEYIMNAIVQKIQEKLYMKAAYTGVYNASGTDTVDLTNGFLKLVADLITATTITPVTTGAVTSSNVITSVEAMCDAIEAKYRTIGGWELKVNDTIFNWYWKKRRETYGNIVTTYDGSIRLINSLPIEGYNVTLVREIGLGSSQRMIATPHDNMAWLFDSASDAQNMEIQKFDRGLKILIDLKAGFGFVRALDGYLVVNDQA